MKTYREGMNVGWYKNWNSSKYLLARDFSGTSTVARNLLQVSKRTSEKF